MPLPSATDDIWTMWEHPHDRLFREVFSDPEEAGPLLKWILPPEIEVLVDWTTLKRVSPETISPELEESESDLIYSVQFRGEGEVELYLLAEHQSRVDMRMALRFLTYMTKQWNQAKEAGTPLPVLIPILISHDERGWTGGLDFAELLALHPEDAARLGRFLPRFDVLLDDLAGVPEDELGDRGLKPYGEVALRMLKVLRTSVHPLDDLRRWLPLMNKVERARLPRLTRLFNYLLSVTAADPQGAVDVIAPLGQEEKAMGMTTAERLINQGVAKGRVEERAEVLLRLIRLKFPEAVDAALEERVRSADPATLDRGVERILTAESIEAILD
jgi:predicted transposase/invertase (TIGR01784 family)